MLCVMTAGKPTKPSLIAFCAAAVWAAGAHAHHSFSSIYDNSQNVTLEAVVAQFLFVHPHPYLLLSVDAARGSKVSWRAEMDNRFELVDIGITAETFKPGDRVVVSGSPGRAAEHTLYMWRLERPADGLRYEQVGGTPSIRIP
jgi:Family of unknown function (DUF6152)